MATVIGVMDREGWDHRTDIITVIDPRKKEILWIPRDLYCERLGNRINTAFKKGGHELLIEALQEHGLEVENGICVLRSVIERSLIQYKIQVPVEQFEEFYYPLAPQLPIEEGKKIIQFHPPSEWLEGERFHQWIGARVPLEGYQDASGDLARIRRQQILLRRMLEEGFDFAHVGLGGISMTSPRALEEVTKLRADWRFRTLEDLKPVTKHSMYVFIRQRT